MKIEEEIKKYGIENKVPISLDDTLTFLISTINENNSNKILEIGTAIGYSAIEMAENSCAQHIDTLEIDEARFNIANENIKKRGLENKISTHLVDAMDFIKKTKSKYDLIYLDGPKGQYVNYLPYLTKILNPNGIIFADNLFFHGMVTGEIPVSRGVRAMIKGLHKYIDAISNQDKYATTIYKIGDGVGVTKLKKT